MAKQFTYDEDWKSAELTCPICGWKGTFEQGDAEYYDELLDCSCPKCSFLTAPILAIVSYYSKKAPDSEKQIQNEAQKLKNEWEASTLKSIEQLPDLPEPNLKFAWDWIRDDSNRSYTIIRNGDKEIWREPACYEGYERFREIAHILKQKYGDHIVDLVPSSASETYLLGDDLTASKQITEVRNALRSKKGGNS